MGKQSTRHKYKTRSEKNREAARAGKLIALGVLVFLLFVIIKNWRGWWAYYKTYFY